MASAFRVLGQPSRLNLLEASSITNFEPPSFQPLNISHSNMTVVEISMHEV